MTHDEAKTMLYNAYQHCVSRSRYPRDDEDNASLILIVLWGALNGNPIAIGIIKKFGL